jgi:predicted dehydrogenase
MQPLMQPLGVMKPLRVALIGCGVISHDHARAFADAGGNRDRAQLVAFCDSDPQRAQATYATYAEALNAGVTAPASPESAPGAQAVYESTAATIETRPEATTTQSYQEILARPDIDAVDLCLPHDLHADMMILAAQAGKHILCEKPLAMTVADCDRMIEAAREHNVVLMHGENLRMVAHIERAAQMVQEGAVGKVVGVQGTFAYWQRAHMNTGWRGRSTQAGGGMLIDGGIHLVDAMRHVGGDVISLQAMSGAYREDTGDGEDLVVVNLRYTGGHYGQIFACHSTQGRGAAPFMTVYGMEGVLSLDAYKGESITLFKNGQEPQTESLPSSWQSSFVREVTHFIDVLQNGEPLRARPEDGRENLRLVLAAYESARTGQEVKL